MGWRLDRTRHEAFRKSAICHVLAAFAFLASEGFGLAPLRTWLTVSLAGGLLLTGLLMRFHRRKAVFLSRAVCCVGIFALGLCALPYPEAMSSNGSDLGMVKAVLAGVLLVCVFSAINTVPASGSSVKDGKESRF